MPACPYASVATGTSTLTAPAGTLAWAGTETMPPGPTDSVTSVSADCAAEIVSLSEVPPPSATLESTGTSDTTVGAAALTVIWLDALEPFRLAVTVASPGERPATEIGALSCPAGTVTEDGTEAIPVLLLETATAVSLACAAEIVS
jgi:hypothetical protein